MKNYPQPQLFGGLTLVEKTYTYDEIIASPSFTTKETKPIVNKFWNRNFFLLWQGQFISQFGVQATNIAMMLWIKHVTGSAFLMGMAMMLSNLPAVFLEPIGGVIADKYSRKKILIYADLLCAVAILTVSGLIVLFPDNTIWGLVALFPAVILIGSAQAFFRPACTACIPDIVPADKLSAANSFNQGNFVIAQLVGNGLGGWLYRVFGAGFLFLLDGFSYLFSATSEIFISIPEQTVQSKKESKKDFSKSLADLKEDLLFGVKYFWRDLGLRYFFIMNAVQNFFTMPAIVLLPFFVEDHLHGNSVWFGLLLAGFGIGSLLGYIGAGIFSLDGPKRCISLIISYLLYGSLAIIVGLAPTLTIALILIFMMGIFSGYNHINFVTIVQKRIPSDIRGRVFGIIAAVSFSVTPIAMGLAGIIAELVNGNVPLIYIVSGIILLSTFSFMLLFNPYLRAFLAFDSISKSNCK